MILYTFVDNSGYEPRYYLNYGKMILDLIYPDLSEEAKEEYFSPFIPDLQDYAKATTSATDAAQFLRDLCPFPEDSIFDVTKIWPLPIYADTNEEKANSLIFRTFLCQYLFPKYWELYLFPYAKDETEAEKERVYKTFFNRFAQLCVATFNKYLPIIKAYKEKEGELMDKLASESDTISRFNDTPQAGGDFADEDHTTNATTAHSETKSDYETPINRLREIRDKYENLYNAWALDFDILFTKGETGEL